MWSNLPAWRIFAAELKSFKLKNPHDLEFRMKAKDLHTQIPQRVQVGHSDLHVDQRKAAWFESDICVSHAS